ncbi:hypothetical protein BTVI_96332 [Pitangus sulphuratus]|nr:hypothetical protein BTVI_96332 [Pitangus sulphuratus]
MALHQRWLVPSLCGWEAVEKCDPGGDMGKYVCVCSCVSQQQQEQDPTNLYISNLPVSMDEQELENMLKPFGHVISTRILRDANGVSRGVGFARMESTEKCEVVIQHFNGKYLKTPPGLPGVAVNWEGFAFLSPSPLIQALVFWFRFAS